MKTGASILLPVLLMPWASFGQIAAVNESDAVVTERGEHHRVLSRSSIETLPDGRTRSQVRSYTELGTGMHWRDENGNWIESQETIEPAPGGAVAHQGAIKAAWAANLNGDFVLHAVTPDGKSFKSRLLGIAFTSTTGESALIAEPKDRLGQIVGNQVLYLDAFNGPFRADVRFSYTLAGISQEILIREAVPSPAEYNLDPARTRLEIWTEFLEAPTPVKTTSVLKAETDALARAGAVEPDLTDDSLDFGLLRIGPGKGFPLEVEAGIPGEDSVAVGKSWVQVPDGKAVRTFLIEKIDYSDVRAQLDALPQAAALNGRGHQRGQAARAAPQRSRLLASLRAPEGKGPNRAGPMRLAAAAPPAKGFNFDYESLLVNTNDFVFKGGETYFILANVNLAGKTVIEGTSVLKFTNGNTAAKLVIQGPLECRTDSYRPAVFVGKDENAVGEIVAGSTGNPNTNYYGYYLDIAGNTNEIDLHHVQMRRAYYGVNMNSSSKLLLRHAQIGGTYSALTVFGAQTRLRNVLIHDSNFAKNLTFAGHGWGPGRDNAIHRGPGIPGATPGSDGLYENGIAHDSGGANLSDLGTQISSGTIRFCKPCLIQIHSCRISPTFIQSLASLTKCKVVAAASSCRPYAPNPRWWESIQGVWKERPDQGGGYVGFWESDGGGPVREIGPVYEPR